MHLILDRLNYSPKHFLIAVKIIRMIHRTFQLKSRRILKTRLGRNFYEEVVMFSRKEMVKKKKTENLTKQYLFQGQSERSKHWFGLDIKWVEENVSTR